MRTSIFTLSFLFCLTFAFSNKELPFSEFKFGDKKEKFNTDLQDISNPNSWEETTFNFLEKSELFGKIPSKIRLDFWNNRLYLVNFTMAISDRNELVEQLTKKYGKSWSYSTDSTSLNWNAKNLEILSYTYDGTFVISFSDPSQKEFHFVDLFHGILFYLIVVIVGLFVVYWFIYWLITSYCRNCKTINMKYQEISLENPTDYSHMDGVQVFFERPEMHYDKVHKFKCNKCGNIRNDRFGSWWSWRNKHK